MSRWHESGCKHPEVVVAGGLPYCNYCFTLPSLEDATAGIGTPDAPRLQSTNQSIADLNLAWPSVVSYSAASSSLHCESARSSVSPAVVDGSSDNAPVSQDHTTVFPEILSGDDIRLLRLTPGESDNPIHAHIDRTSLRSSSPSTYEALSYTWADESGDCARRYPIFVGAYWDIVYVTHNCAEALRSVRYYDEEVALGGLLENANEKTHQTSLMREIYVGASSVIVYLGGASADSVIAINYLRETTAGLSVSRHSEVIDQNSRAALRSLFSRPYFSRLWAIQEIVLAQRLEIVCGQHSVSWLNGPSRLDFSNASAPSWFFDCMSWDGFTGRGLLRLLLDASSYNCSDPRDKIFGVLGLMTQKFVRPDYGISVEAVYIGITAYLIKNCLAFEILALAGYDREDINMPSWVPDWSQKLVQRFPEALLLSDEDPWDVEDGTDCAIPLVFDDINESEPDVTIDAGTGSLRTRAIKLCDISKDTARVTCQNKVVMDMGQRGNLIVNVLNQPYQIGTDSVFLLSGWDYPVVLSARGTDSYALVSVCAMYFGPPSSGTWMMPWDNLALPHDEIRASKFSREEKNAILNFYSTLMELSSGLPNTPPDSDAFAVARNSFLDFSLLLSMGLPEVESRLQDTWYHLDQSLGWMFRDQIAVRKLMSHLSCQSQEDRSGEGTLQLEGWEESQFEHYGVQLPLTFKYDLGQFCRSFVQHPVPSSATDLDEAWTPVFPKLKSHLDEIQRWAEVTAQLLGVFNCPGELLDKRWTSLPGTQLPNQWEDFCNSIESADLRGSANRSIKAGSCWNWSEFRDSLRLRKRLWDCRAPRPLDRSVNSNVASRLVLKTLGLELEKQDTITIV